MLHLLKGLMQRQVFCLRFGVLPSVSAACPLETEAAEDSEIQLSLCNSCSRAYRAFPEPQPRPGRWRIAPPLDRATIAWPPSPLLAVTIFVLCFFSKGPGLGLRRRCRPWRSRPKPYPGSPESPCCPSGEPGLSSESALRGCPGDLACRATARWLGECCGWGRDGASFGPQLLIVPHPTPRLADPGSPSYLG